jgi:perosamine synthetase
MTDLTNPTKFLGNELKYFQQVLNSESWSGTAGNWNQTLEKAFAEKIGAKYAVAFNSGTATLHATLEAAGIRPGDEVISPALTVMMDTTATLHANAVPVYADIDPDSFNVTAEEIEQKITDRTKVIITVSLYGLSPDMAPIMELAKKHNILVVEDNAQSMLNTYKGQNVGTIGDIASYSFENTKHLSCGEGGIIVTDSEELAERARKVGGHGFKNLRADEGRVRLNGDVFQHPDYKRHDSLGWNYRLSEFSAALALAQLERAEELVGLRIKSANMFIEVMKETDYLVPQMTPEGYTNSYYTLGVKYLGKEKMGVSWEKFRKTYVDAGGDGIYGAWSVPYLEPLMVEGKYKQRYPEIYKDLSFESGICPVAEKIQSQLMQFKTNYRDLNLAEQKAEILRKVLSNFR